ncbi:MAG: hypothetical protein DCC55_04830 [Chloroflexi bacterium]|nr:MAG: hypothetical protein DCC55_04830 [Chloroflexota bacterium]
MSDYLLDANHLSPLVTPNHPLRNKVIERLEAGDRFAVATPALHEFLFGIASAPRADKNWREWEYLSPSFTYYQIDHDDAASAARLRVDLQRRGRQLGAIDSLIAIVAARNDLILLTTDRDFLAVPDLKQENWRS